VSTTIDRLLIVQDRDRKIAELTREHDDIPARIQQVEARLTAHRDALHAAQEELKKSGATTKQIEGDIDARKQKIAKFREQQFQIKSNVEYRALEHEIATVQKEIRGLEDQELSVMEQMESLRHTIGEREEDLKKEGSRVVDDQAVFQQRLAKIEAEIHDLKVDRDALASEVDQAWLARYERILKRTGDYAVVRVERNSENKDKFSCGGCHMNLPPHIVHEAKKCLALTECSFCSRILYYQP
jgi:uncharacterized protein